MWKNWFGLGASTIMFNMWTCRCCNSSPNKHGTKHFLETGHPIIKSYEPEEDWKWCMSMTFFWNDLTEEYSSLK
jgi:hypothetical protein